MLCVRCKNPLPAGADRCLRCFALNPQNRAGATTPPPERASDKPRTQDERDEFFRSPITDPELDAAFVRLQSEPPQPKPVPVSIASDPPKPMSPSIASIASDPPPADLPFELQEPVTSPKIVWPRPKKPAPRARQLPLPPPVTPPPRAAAQAAKPPPADAGLSTPTLQFAAHPVQDGDDLGDIEIGVIDKSQPLPTPPPPETTNRFSQPRQQGAPPVDEESPADVTAQFVKPLPLALSPFAPRPDEPVSEQPPDEPPEPNMFRADAITEPPTPPPPVDPLSTSFDFGAGGGVQPNAFLETPLEVEPAGSLPPPRGALNRARSPWAPLGARLASWIIDGLLLLVCVALQALVAAQVVGVERIAPRGFGSVDYWLDAVARGPHLAALWGGLLAALALGYSWLFGWVGGRTPGMALAGLRLKRVTGEPVRGGRALVRALLALPSAGLALFGFFLALFDRRGQALHDKLTGTAVVRDGAELASEGGPA